MHSFFYCLCLFLLIVPLSGCSKYCSTTKKKRYYLTEKQNTCISFPPSYIPLRSPNPFSHHSLQKRIPLITKNSFICKGSSKNPVILQAQAYLQDCPGGEYHGFPQYKGKEYINPELILLLNHIRSTLQSPITIITGHQCRKHFDYCQNSASHLPHLFGSAVIFRVNRAFITPEQICIAIKSFYSSSTESDTHTFTSELPYPNMNNSRLSVLFFHDATITDIEEKSFIQIIMKNIPLKIELA